ncbi:MAG: hypothetical protein RJB38_2448 [Pseudomonadota bacterium]
MISVVLEMVLLNNDDLEEGFFEVVEFFTGREVFTSGPELVLKRNSCLLEEVLSAERGCFRELVAIISSKNRGGD